MKRTAGILLLVATALVGGASLFAADDETKPDYYPLKVGTKWHYELNANGKKMTVTNAIAKTETIDEAALPAGDDDRRQGQSDRTSDGHRQGSLPQSNQRNRNHTAGLPPEVSDQGR